MWMYVRIIDFVCANVTVKDVHFLTLRTSFIVDK